eukprot:CAMPEP_0118921512 /NCGR_PEP_ID=MMETSP1169-20130426/762_1 /TAXON_ID=36882 /ORGANISM="Pyramimonas obovata, Strain CCMP722" /LENGTH=295 /DNA_ID=CAMNT_0006862243 /DNA_START=199 /DNA_END=1083 /DNA_ORIENTATION=+
MVGWDSESVGNGENGTGKKANFGKCVSLDTGLSTVGRFTLLDCDSYVKSPNSKRVKFTVSKRVLQVETFSKDEICGDTASAGAAITMDEINSALQAEDPDYATLARKRHERLKGFCQRWRAKKVFMALAQLRADRKAELQKELIDVEPIDVNGQVDAPHSVQPTVIEAHTSPPEDPRSEGSTVSQDGRPSEERDHVRPVPEVLEAPHAAMHPLWRLHMLHYQPRGTLVKVASRSVVGDLKPCVTWAANARDWSLCSLKKGVSGLNESIRVGYNPKYADFANFRQAFWSKEGNPTW